MRFLRIGRLIVLDSGRWALDAFQPVAAVLDPVTGRLRRVVSWQEQPPPPPGETWPPPTALGAEDSSWVQQPRPIEEESCTRRILGRYADLERRLRRRVRLFDGLGRIDAPELADIQLMEDVDTAALPDVTQAHDGVLAI